MNLSKRLQAVATLVDIGSRVIDVGCDHAYLDIYLTKNNSNTCIATDISANALEIAKENISKYKLKNKIKIKQANGLEGIQIDKNDNVVISGMGTYTILEILNTNKLSDTLIISANNKINILREAVIGKGYYIDSELFIIDRGKPYIIIKFKKGFVKYKKDDYLFGPILKYNTEYKNYMINKYESIKKAISNKNLKAKMKYNLLILKIKMLSFKKQKQV